MTLAFILQMFITKQSTQIYSLVKPGLVAQEPKIQVKGMNLKVQSQEKFRINNQERSNWMSISQRTYINPVSMEWKA